MVSKLPCAQYLRLYLKRLIFIGQLKLPFHWTNTEVEPPCKFVVLVLLLQPKKIYSLVYLSQIREYKWRRGKQIKPIKH